jgi:hydroxymethylbilane synthase
MERIYKIGSRASPLALRQVKEILKALRKHCSIKTEIVSIDTYGDKDKRTPISQIEGSDFFTREIDEALLNGEIDFAIHSAKDLPAVLPEGLTVAALTKSIAPYDVLVSKNRLRLDGLKKGAKIGTSSMRRKLQLEKFRADFQVVDIRGNIEQRLRLLDETGLDAIVIAAAGLLRLGLAHRITQWIPMGILRPHPLQGVLAIVVKKENLELIDLLSVIDSRKSRVWKAKSI